MLNRDAEILDHFARFWGQPARISKYDHQIDLVPKPIYIAEFPPLSEDKDWVFATVGASRLTMPAVQGQFQSKTDLRMELFMYARRHYEGLPDVLAGLAAYPFQNKVILGPGHIIHGDHAIAPESPLTDILLTWPYFEPQGFNVVHHGDGSHTQILWVIPIYASEGQFFKQYGWDALEDLFREHETDTSDLRRSPVA